MTNIREKLANARELCPGMSRDFYILTDYMSKNTKDELVPMEMMRLSVCVQNDIQTGRNGLEGELPEELAQRRNFVLYEIQWIPQLVDAIADEEFATEFRMHWKECIGTVPPKRVDTKAVETDTEYPAYVKAAIDWWANAIVSPKFDDGEALPALFAFLMAGAAKEYTPAEIKTFKEALAKGIQDEMSKYGRCNLSVDYHPCRVLARAGNLIGVNDMIGYPCIVLARAGNLIGVNDMVGYPCKTDMYVSEEKVSVRAGYGAPVEVIWQA